MTLRSRLFGAISFTLCLLLAGVLLGNAVTERQRYDRALYWHRAALDFAAARAAARGPASLADSELLRGGVLDPRLSALAWIRETRGEFEVRLVAGGAGAGDWKARALDLAGQALARGRTLAEGDVRAVPVHWSAPGEPAARDVVVLQATSLGMEPAGAAVAMYFTVVCAGLALLGVTWLIVDRFVSRPLREVILGANRVAEGDYTQLVPSSGGEDEIQRVIQSFNQMMVEIGDLQGRLRERIGAAVRDARRTQDSLVIAQRLAATGRLAAGIAHEVNNPLAGMLNAVRALKSRKMSPEKQAEYLDMVEEGLIRIQRTVAKILQFTPHKVAPQTVHLMDVVQPVLALARHRAQDAGVEVVVEGADQPALVFGDLYELQQALLNVVLNALDAMQEADREDPHLLLRLTVEGDEVHLLVRDDGTGMAKEDLDRAFDFFFTTKETGKGSGLGLATVHKILSDHLGRVELRPRGEDERKGMDVVLTLPLFRG